MIRPLNESDVEAFIKIRSDSLLFSPRSFGADPIPGIEMDAKTTREDLKAKNESNFILGYFEEGKLMGMLGFIRHQRVKTKHRAFIWGVFVYPDHRGKGIGKALLEECLNRANQLEGLEKVSLSVTHVSAVAIGLYEHLGFQPYAREKDALMWKGEPLDEIFMEKRLK